MPPKKKAEAAPTASPATPAPAGYVSIRRVANGYIVHTSAWEDEGEFGGRASYVFTNAEAALTKATSLLIPQPKATKARKPRAEYPA